MSNLTETEIHVLHEALDDEYCARGTYDQVISDFGEVPPFSNIREAEGRHLEALCTLFVCCGLPVPENPWPGKVARYASLQAACEAGEAAEIVNGEMFDRLLGATQRPDILTVLCNLQEASQERHPPSFQRCAQDSAGSGGHGRRHRGGRGRG